MWNLPWVSMALSYNWPNSYKWNNIIILHKPFTNRHIDRWCGNFPWVSIAPSDRNMSAFWRVYTLKKVRNWISRVVIKMTKKTKRVSKRKTGFFTFFMLHFTSLIQLLGVGKFIKYTSCKPKSHFTWQETKLSYTLVIKVSM